MAKDMGCLRIEVSKHVLECPAGKSEGPPATLTTVLAMTRVSSNRQRITQCQDNHVSRHAHSNHLNPSIANASSARDGGRSDGCPCAASQAKESCRRDSINITVTLCCILPLQISCTCVLCLHESAWNTNVGLDKTRDLTRSRPCSGQVIQTRCYIADADVACH